MLSTFPSPKLLLLIAIPMVVSFSSVSIPYNNKNGGQFTAGNTQKETEAAVTAPWRVAMDIGREPLSTMPFDWARSGCRMPLVIPSVLSKDAIQPQMETVSFTDVGGAVVRPVLGGELNLKNNQELSFSLTFPEAMTRRDVAINAGTTVYCTGRVYSKSELESLNQAFYKAREQAWDIGGELNEMTKLQSAPKRWNEEKQRWERQNPDINVFAWAQKRIQYMMAKSRLNQCNEQRPDPNLLSGIGFFPALKEDAYVVKEGLVRSQDGAVMGRWSMEPILDRPLSYYR